MSSRWVRVAENLFRKGKGTDLWLRYRRIGRPPVEERIGQVSLSEARRILAERRTNESRTLSGLQPAPKSFTIGEAIQRHLENKKSRVSRGTYEAYVYHRKHLEASLGAIDARLLTEDDWEDHVRRRRKAGVTGSTRNRELTFLKAALRHCKGIPRDLLADVEKEPEPPPGSMAHEYTPDELARIMAASAPAPWFGRLVVILYETGGRLSELCQIRLSEITDETSHSGWGLTFLAETTKRKIRTRWIPLSDPAIRAVRDQSAEALRMGSPYLFPARRDPTTHVSGSAVDEFWKSVRTRTGIKGRIHDFRHTFITRMLMKGCSAETVAKMVGHTSTIMIHRVYGHLFRGHREDMVEAIRGRVPAGETTARGEHTESPATASHRDKHGAIH